MTGAISRAPGGLRLRKPQAVVIGTVLAVIIVLAMMFPRHRVLSCYGTDHLCFVQDRGPTSSRRYGERGGSHDRTTAALRRPVNGYVDPSSTSSGGPVANRT